MIEPHPALLSGDDIIDRIDRAIEKGCYRLGYAFDLLAERDFRMSGKMEGE